MSSGLSSMASPNPGSGTSFTKRGAHQEGGPPMRDESGSRTITESSYCPMELRRGTEPWRFQDFKVHKILGEGAMSTVVQCSCLRTEALVAIKMYHKERMNTLNIKQVAREIEIHASVLHPHIIKLFAAFEDGDGIYLVQELAPRGDLYAELSRHGGYMLEAHVVKNVMQPFLSALSYLHSLGILHRDIKPENVLLAADGEIKLADFGLAINTTKEKPMSRVGTLDYMPPEIAALPRAGSPIPLAPLPPPHPDGGNYGLPADVWCTGVLAFELLVGGPPFEADTKEATYIRILKVDAVAPEHLSEAARDFLKRTLMKDPTKRPTVGQLQKHAWLKNVQRPRSMHVSPTTTTATVVRNVPSPVVAAYAVTAGPSEGDAAAGYDAGADPDTPTAQQQAIAIAVAAAAVGAQPARSAAGSPSAASGSSSSPTPTRAMSFGSLLTGRFTPKPSKPLSLSALKSSASLDSLSSTPASGAPLSASSPRTPASAVAGGLDVGSPAAPGSFARFDPVDLLGTGGTSPLTGPVDGDDDLIPASFPPSLVSVLGRGEGPGQQQQLALESPRRTGMLGAYLKKLSLGALAVGKGKDHGGEGQQAGKGQDTEGWNKAASSPLQRKSRLGFGSPGPVNLQG